MPEPDHIVRQGDHGVSIAATLTDEDDEPVILTGASVAFYLVPIAGGSAIALTGTVSVTGATTGQVEYEWQDGDTDTEGWYAANWKVTYGGGALQSFPNGDPTVVLITPEAVGD